TAAASSITVTRIDRAVALFIARLVLAAFYHGYGSQEKCYLGQKENQIHRGEKANFDVGLN
ncbi:MAG TPA: hypothetical protein VGK77_13410, partial [Candidatus Binatia bacterium]